ncbi:MAG TPA: M4 family metallopeptidase [Saprospiraceae bacterium]|nr:M4 family metallopeptidase [Saprospiraceae bacterium]
MTDKLPGRVDGKDLDQTSGDEQIRLKRKMLAQIPVAMKKNAMMSSFKAKTVLYREVYDAKQIPVKIGKLLWKEGQPMIKNDTDAKNVIVGAGLVWNFYKKLFKRNSIDNNGLPILQTIRYRENAYEDYYNAFWDGEQMFYGTGNRKYTGSFTSDLDIIAHELTHGVIDFEARLEYENQSGALNESLADVFGIMIKQWANKTPARKSDWLIGKNILKGKNALRSLKAPGTAYINDPVFGNDPQPAVMKDFVKMPNTEKGDWGAVHYNSGIPNYAFYVACYEQGGHSWEKVGAAWYAALTNPRLLKPHSNFKDAANATVKSAATLFGKNSLPVQAIEKGWQTAGVI